MSIRNLSKHFRQRGGDPVAAVDDLSLDVEDGEFLVILGPSGSGKTTLLRCVAGLERADVGEITIDDVTVYSSERGVWVPPERRGVSMVFQNYALWPHMTAFDNVAYPLRARHVRSGDVGGRVREALEMVGCEALAHRHPGALSGGQQQRIALARAIVTGSSVVLFDEPLSSIDARVRDELRRELVALQRELRFTGIYITHDQTEAMVMGHRVAVLADGAIVELASPRKLYEDPESAYVAEFTGASNRFDGAVESHIEDDVIVMSTIGQITARRRGTTLSRGDSVAVICRPKDLMVTRDEPVVDHGNKWRCRVEALIYLGHATELTLRLPEGESVLAWWPGDAVPGEGEDIWLTVDPQHVKLVFF